MKTRAATSGAECLYRCAFKKKNFLKESILPTQAIPLRQIWPEDMVFAIIPNPHIYSMFKSVDKRGGYWTVFMENVQILTS